MAPIPVSSGRSDRHRLDRGGNRQLNRALHVIAITRGRLDPASRAYLQRREAEGKTRTEAMRCLKRHPCTPLPPAAIATAEISSGERCDERLAYGRVAMLFLKRSLLHIGIVAGRIVLARTACER